MDANSVPSSSRRVSFDENSLKGDDNPPPNRISFGEMSDVINVKTKKPPPVPMKEGNTSKTFDTFMTGVDIEDEDVSDEEDLQFDDDQGFLSEIMMCLDANRVSELRDEFLKQEGGLSLNDFVEVMKKTLPKSENFALLVAAGLTPLRLVAQLCELFLAVDVNGDGTLEWEEFTGFVVEMGLAGQDHHPDAIQQYRCAGQADVGKITSYIEQIYYFPENERGLRLGPERGVPRGALGHPAQDLPHPDQPDVHDLG
eukprot:CAMPEP_0194702506 /NCGR_PEP_ID=MMETSP0295-20121207/26929_1 /TAXON_ID=39354 /ORGANISM="Heterosigma akashiwo, Strain CCMP2393" /LENGTH=254 /DNA_ID=CAMNT_0039597115 /DNA_START=45 /DNA_END=806 /DNA_ORIENTATION=+